VVLLLRDSIRLYITKKHLIIILISTNFWYHISFDMYPIKNCFQMLMKLQIMEENLTLQHVSDVKKNN
jgi:hypothetical protein